MAQLLNGNVVITPSKADAALAKESVQQLAAHMGDASGSRLQVRRGEITEEIILPTSALRLLVGILEELGQGNAVALTPLRAELTSQQAADMLGVSRPHLIKLLDDGAIPSRKVGTHRRVSSRDVLDYKREALARRHAGLDELQAPSQDLGLGY